MPILGITASSVVAAYKMVVATIGSRIFGSYNGTEFSYAGTPSSYTSKFEYLTASSSLSTIEVISNGSKFIKYGNTFIFSSTDGVTWTSDFVLVGRKFKDLAYSSTAAPGYEYLLADTDGSAADPIMRSTDAITWTTVFKPSISAKIHRVLTAGNAVIYTATDDTTADLTVWVTSGTTVWTSLTTTISGGVVNSLELINGYVYAVGETPHIYRINTANPASDTWTTFANNPGGIPTAAVLYGLKYGNGRYVGVWLDATQDTIGSISSTDGTTWVSSFVGSGFRATNALSTSSDRFGFEFYDGLFWTFAEDSKTGYSGIYTSIDGITWTLNSTNSAIISPNFDNNASIAFAGNRMAAFNTGTDNIYISQKQTTTASTSNDYVSWTTIPVGGTPTASADVDWVAGWYDTELKTFIFHGRNADFSDYVKYYNGVSWTTIANEVEGNQIGRYLYKDSVHVIVRQKSGNGTLYSTDGIIWTTSTGYSNSHDITGTTGTREPLGTVMGAVGGGYFVVGSRGTSSTSGRRMNKSTDGATWTTVTITGISWGVDREPADLKYVNGAWVVVIENGTIHRSTDLTTWTSSAPGLTLSSTTFRSNILATDSNYIYAISRSNTAGASVPMFQSTDGITWTTYASAAYGDFSGVYKIGDTWYTVKISDDLVYRSTDATTWTSVSGNFPYSTELFTLTTDGKDIFAMSSSGSVLRSEISSQTQLPGFEAKDLLYVPKETSGLTNDKYVLSGKNAFISNNGLSWTSIVNPQVFGSDGPKRAEYLNGKFYIGGEGSSIIQSTDAVTWTGVKTKLVHKSDPASDTAATTYLAGMSYANSILGVASSDPDPNSTAIARTFRYRPTLDDADTLEMVDSYNFVTFASYALGATAMQDIKYFESAGYWIANGNSGVIRYSTDSITWATVVTSYLQTLNSGGSFIDTYSARIPSIFVCGDSGRIVKSTNGTTWATVVSAGTTAHVNGMVASTDGILLAVAGVSAQGLAHYLRSTNGVTWTTGLLYTAAANVKASNPSYGYDQGLGQNVFAVSTGTSTAPVIKKSTDGITWTTAGAVGATSTSSFGFSDNLKKWYFADGASFAVSTNLTTWTTLSSVGGANFYIEEIPGFLIIAKGSALTYAKASTDGVTWTTVPYTGSGLHRGLDYDARNRRLVLMDNTTAAYATTSSWVANVTSLNQNSDATKHIMIANGVPIESTSFAEWSGVQAYSVQPNIGANYFLVKAKYLNNKFVVAGYTTNSTPRVAYSTDGITWTTVSVGLGNTNQGRSIAWNGTTWVAVANGGTNSQTAATSTDLITWTTRTAYAAAAMHDVHYAIDKFVVVGEKAGIIYSTDGTTWATAVAQSGATTTHLYFVDNQTSIRTGTLWVAAGKQIKTSTNGITWTTSTYPTGISTTGVTRMINWQGKFVLVDTTNNLFATSTDGITWSTSTISVATKNYSAIDSAYVDGNKLFSIWSASYGITLEYTTDGVTWTSVPRIKSTTGPTDYISNGSVSVGYRGLTSQGGNGISSVYASLNSGLVSPKFIAQARDIYVGPEGIFTNSSTAATTYGGFQKLVSGIFSKVSYNSKNGYTVTGPAGIYRSTDGVVWTSTSISSAGQFAIGDIA